MCVSAFFQKFAHVGNSLRTSRSNLYPTQIRGNRIMMLDTYALFSQLRSAWELLFFATRFFFLSIAAGVQHRWQRMSLPKEWPRVRAPVPAPRGLCRVYRHVAFSRLDEAKLSTSRGNGQSCFTRLSVQISRGNGDTSLEVLHTRCRSQRVKRQQTSFFTR